jgi:spore coat polysaccharide biosynthesis protein SpsF
MKKKMKVIATVEARMASTRLPGKTMMKVIGKPILELVVERLRMAKTVDEVVVATTVNPKDNVIVEFCEGEGIPYHRDSEEDVLGRVIEAAKKFKGDIIIQSGADNPFYDPDLVDELIKIYKTGKYDYVCNDMELTYPLGVDAHIMSIETLEEIGEKATKPRERDDVPRYIWEHPKEYRIFNLKATKKLHRPEFRLTLDYEEDMILTRKIYEALYPKNPKFTTLDVIKFLDTRPELKKINAHCVQRVAPFLP